VKHQGLPVAGEFKAVYVSSRKVFVGSRLRRTRKLFALDCVFTRLTGSGRFTIRIHAENPVIKALHLKNVYRFEEVDQVGFKVIRDVVTDLDMGTVYKLSKG
jgi:hypothetical protein